MLPLLPAPPERPATLGPLAIAAPGSGAFAMQASVVAGPGAGLDFAGLVSAALPPAAATVPASPDPAPLASVPAEAACAASVPGGTILPGPGGDLPPTPAAAPVDPRQNPVVPAIAAMPKRAALIAAPTPQAQPVPETAQPPTPSADLSPLAAPGPASTEDAVETEAAPAPGLTPAPLPEPVRTEDEASIADGPPVSPSGAEANGPAEPAASPAAVMILAIVPAAPVLLATAQQGAAVPPALVPVSKPIRIAFAPTLRSVDAAQPVPVVQPGGPLSGSEPAAPPSSEPQAASPTPAAVLPTAEAAPAVAAPVPAPPPSGVSTLVPDRAEPRVAPQQETAIAQVGELREALRAGRPAMTLNHAEFGLVSLRLETAAGPDQWRAVLASRDPGFVPAVQAALAERAVAAAAALDGGGSLSGQTGSGPQTGAGDHRYGASPNGGQGGSSPYLGQSSGRDGEAAPDHRRPSTAAALAARVEEEDPGSPASRMSGMFA